MFERKELLQPVEPVATELGDVVPAVAVGHDRRHRDQRQFRKRVDHFRRLTGIIQLAQSRHQHAYRIVHRIPACRENPFITRHIHVPRPPEVSTSFTPTPTPQCPPLSRYVHPSCDCPVVTPYTTVPATGWWLPASTLRVRAATRRGRRGSGNHRIRCAVSECGEGPLPES